MLICDSTLPSCDKITNESTQNISVMLSFLFIFSVAHGTMSEEAITDYFNLGVDLETLYTQWSKVTFQICCSRMVILKN